MMRQYSHPSVGCIRQKESDDKHEDAEYLIISLGPFCFVSRRKDHRAAVGHQVNVQVFALEEVERSRRQQSMNWALRDPGRNLPASPPG